MELIFGESEHLIDDKGRINIPRKVLPLFQYGGFITRAVNGQSLTFYPILEWDKMKNSLSLHEYTDLVSEKIARFFGCGTEVRIDAQGRLTIPPTLRRRAHLDKEVTMIAMGNKVEIWDTNTWLEYDAQHLTGEEIGTAMAEIHGRRAQCVDAA